MTCDSLFSTPKLMNENQQVWLVGACGMSDMLLKFETGSASLPDTSASCCENILVLILPTGIQEKVSDLQWK